MILIPLWAKEHPVDKSAAHPFWSSAQLIMANTKAPVTFAFLAMTPEQHEIL